MNKRGALITLVVLFVGLIIPTIFNIFFDEGNDERKEEGSVKEDNPIRVFTPEQLAEYDGIKENRLLLAFLGTIYDVTKGARNYMKGKAYHYFVGKDGSRSFVTGDFNDESEDKDNVITLTCKEIFTLISWQTLLDDKYDFVGVLEGRFFDKNGKETPYKNILFDRINECQKEKEAEEEYRRKYPPCNISWNADEGSKVWCTKNSGGMLRTWVGVPRQLYTPGREPQCVCVDIENESSPNKFKLYKDCPVTSTACTVTDTK